LDDPEHEVGNIQKCFASGFDRVILVSVDKKIMSASNILLSAILSEQDRIRVTYLMPEEVLTFLDEQGAMNAGKEQ
jgi:hypothetical protein